MSANSTSESKVITFPQMSLTRSSSGGSACSTSQPCLASVRPACSIADTVAGGRVHAGDLRDQGGARAFRNGAGQGCVDGLGIPAVSPAQYREAEPQIRDRARHRPVAQERVRHAEVRDVHGRQRDSSHRGFQRGDPAAVGWIAQRSTDVVAEPEGRHAGRQGRRLTAARAARRQVGVPRVAGAAAERVVGVETYAHLRQVRAPQGNATGALHGAGR